MSVFGEKLKLIVDLHDYTKEELASGEIVVEVDLDDYDLINIDEAEDVIDTDEFISNLDDDTLEDELRKRHLYFEMENYVDFSRNAIEKSPDSCKTFLCDILGLMYSVPVETIMDEVKRRLT